MKRLSLALISGLLAVLILSPQILAQPPAYEAKGFVSVTPAHPRLTAVDPYAYPVSTDVLPARPFLYSVDENGITITRFNDNKVVGAWPWPKAPDVIYTVTPDGGFKGLVPPPQWQPVAMTVSYPTEAEIANRVKEIPDLTPPPTYVYVVMAHSGYQWHSSRGALRDTIIPAMTLANDSSMLIQIDVSDPSFSAAADPANPVPPHVAAAILGRGAGQPVYDRATGSVYVGNMPSTSLPASLASFVSVIGRIPPEVAEVEAEVPGISIPVIRCGPQHPESGIPVGKPQAFACYDPSGVHPIDDNEHVGAYGNFTWEFRKLPDWLKAHNDKSTGKLDGILYGTPPATGEWYAEARVHNLDDPYGVFSAWTPVRLLVTPTAEYLPVRVQFAAGVPVAYPLAGTGSCTVVGAPIWIDVQPVAGGCIVMGRAPLDGEHYSFTMPSLAVDGYPGLSLVFSGDVFGEYRFVPLPAGVGLSGMAWRQVSKVADPSTETPVLSLEYIGVEPSTGQLYRILAPPGRPQPPNERPPETALALDVVSTLGSPLLADLIGSRADIAGHLIRFGEVAVEADGDIFVAAVTDSTVSDGALIKVSALSPTPNLPNRIISLPGVQAYSLSLDSDLRTAIPGVDRGQIDHGVLWVAGATSGNVAIIDTVGTVSQVLPVAATGPLGSVSVDFGAQYAYVAAPSLQSIGIFAPQGVARPPMRPRIWSAEEFTWNLGQSAEVRLMATGDGVPTLSTLGTMPPGLHFADNGDGTARIYGIPTAAGGGGGAGGELDVEGGDYAMTVIATGTTGTYAQSFGITVQSPPTITSGSTATFTAGSANSFTVTGTGWPTPIFYVWDAADLPAGVQLVDNENGTSSLIGTPATPGTYTFTINATTDCPPDAAQVFTLVVNPAGSKAPAITSPNTTLFESAGAPFSPDQFTVTSTGSPSPRLSIEGTLPPGVNFIDNGDSTATLGAGCVISLPGMPPACLGFLADSAEGSYSLRIRASNGVSPDATQSFTLVVERNTSILGITPATLSFAYAAGGALPAPQTVNLKTSGDTLPYSVVTTAPWLVAAPVSGTTRGTGAPISVSVNPSGLAAGTYTGTVIAGSSGTEGPYATAMATLTVAATNVLRAMVVAPANLSFQYEVVGGALPPAQTVSVASGGALLKYTVSTDKAKKWLSATPANGFTPGKVSISVDPRKLGPGLHTGVVTIASAGATNGPQKVAVTLLKTATDTDLVSIMFNVGDSPEGLAVNRNTHQLFLNSATEPAGGGTEADENVPAPPDAEPPAPSSVLRVDPETKTVIAETIVHSEGEYIAVNSKTGRVYHASQGTGEVAVIDGTANTVLAYIPLIGKALNGREGAFQPYQIAIDEAQNFIYVGAKAPAIPDPPHVKPFPCKAIHEMPDDEYDCWNPGSVFVIDGNTNKIVAAYFAGDDPEGVVFAAATGKVYASNEDDGSLTVAQGAVRKANGAITAPVVLSTIIRGVPVKGWWQPICDANNYCGERGQAALWPKRSACNGLDDEAEEADKMAVDPDGNVYIIDDRYRVAKIDAKKDTVSTVLEIPGYQCELEVPDGSETLFRNTANNIAFMGLGSKGALYVASEQNTITVIDPVAMKVKSTIAIQGAVEFDAITTDPTLNRVYITDEGQAALWILKGGCANATAKACLK